MLNRLRVTDDVHILATCRVVLRDDPSYVFFTSSATIHSSTQAPCTQPPTNASFLPTCLQYSHDGFTYGVSCSPLTLVGDFSQIELELPQDPKTKASSLPTPPKPSPFRRFTFSLRISFATGVSNVGTMRAQCRHHEPSGGASVFGSGRVYNAARSHDRGCFHDPAGR